MRQGFQPGGVTLASTGTDLAASTEDYLDHYQLTDAVSRLPLADGGIQLRLKPEWAATWAPDYNTLALAHALGSQDSADPWAIKKEILVAQLAAPMDFRFPSLAEWKSAVRIRRHIVEAARQTSLAFDTDEAERPEGYFSYQEDCGFRLAPGKSLIEALVKATQPEVSGARYSFSCYRATEYVILLALARELATANPALHQALESLWRQRAIMSGEFHETFLVEYGSLESPLPPGYYIPGDRLWFRNPDDRSSDVMGYEGSWLFYLGSGLFSNFWKHTEPYTLESKCLEIFHWRDGVHVSPVGKLLMNETLIEARVAETRRHPEQVASIMARMNRYRDPKGVYAEGGCIDVSRECPRWVCPGTTDIVLPAA